MNRLSGITALRSVLGQKFDFLTASGHLFSKGQFVQFFTRVFFSVVLIVFRALIGLKVNGFTNSFSYVYKLNDAFSVMNSRQYMVNTLSEMSLKQLKMFI